jgi:hypothetical protein
VSYVKECRLEALLGVPKHGAAKKRATVRTFFSGTAVTCVVKSAPYQWIMFL